MTRIVFFKSQGYLDRCHFRKRIYVFHPKHYYSLVLNLATQSNVTSHSNENLQSVLTPQDMAVYMRVT